MIDHKTDVQDESLGIREKKDDGISSAGHYIKLFDPPNPHRCRHHLFCRSRRMCLVNVCNRLSTFLCHSSLLISPSLSSLSRPPSRCFPFLSFFLTHAAVISHKNFSIRTGRKNLVILSAHISWR